MCAVLSLALILACAGETLDGIWIGEIDAGEALVSVEVALDRDDSGALAGEISFPADGEHGIPLSSVDAVGRSIVFAIAGVPGEPTFAGELEGDRETIRGVFTQGDRSHPFELRRTAAAPPETIVDEAVRSNVIDALADHLIQGYIYEDAGLRIARELREVYDAGAETPSAPAEFAAALTGELQRLSDDIHLRVEYPRAAPAGPPVGRPEPPPRSEPRPDSASGAGRPELLDGNVGYLEMLHFGGGEASAAEIDAAMAALAGARALILDLRWNMGGGPFMVRYLSTYLFDRPTHLASRVERGRPEPAERWTFESVPGARLGQMPVVLLTSATTISAGESFAFGLRNVGRAAIIGERTAGGGHFGDLVDLGHGFRMFLPRGKTIDPATGEGWEAEGLRPDIEVPAADALEAALEWLDRESGRS